MTGKISPRVAIIVASVIVGVLAVTGVVVFLLTGGSGPSPEAAIQGIVIGEPVSVSLPAEEPVTVSHESGARIEIPAGATTESTTVSVAEVEPPESALEVRRAFDFSVGDVELAQPVKIHIPFELEAGQDAEAVYALHWSEEAADWEPVPGEIDESAQTIVVNTSDLSIYSWVWVKVDASCGVTPESVEVGENFTVTATGTSLTSGNIKLYMKPDVQGPFDLLDGPEAKSDTAIVGEGDGFLLSTTHALEFPSEYEIQCGIFWETIGPGIELKSEESPSALLAVEGEGQFMHRVDLALKKAEAEDIELQRPIYVGESFSIGLEVENLGEQSSIPFDLVATFTSVVDGSVTRVDSIRFGHRQEAAVGAGKGHQLRFSGLAPDDDLPTGDYVVCIEIQYADSSSRDFDTSNDRACLDKYVMHFVEGAMPIFTTLTETKAGHRVWTGIPSGSGLELDAGLGFADDSGIRDDETLKKLYKRLAAELAFRKALQPEHGEQHVLLKGLMENVKGPTEIVGYINDFCGQLEIGCRTAMENTGLLDSGLMDKFPHASHEAIGFAGQSISGVLLFGDVYFSMLVNQALDMQQAFDTLDELWHLPLGPVWKEAVEEARVEVAIMDSNRWNAQALEIVNSKDEIGKFAFTATVGGLTKYAIKKQLLHHLGIATQKALAHSLGVKIAAGAAATTGVGGAVAAAGPVLFVASVWFASEVYSDVQENQDQIGVATLASFLNAALSHPSHKPELREALAYAKYVAYDNFYKSDEGFLQEIASWITFRPGDHDLFLTYTDVERDKALEEVKALVNVASVEVSPESLTLAVGDTAALKGVATTGSGRTVSSRDFDWTSSAPGIAAVSEEGVVTGVSQGEATITVSVGDIRVAAKVAVERGPELPVEPPPPSVSDREALVALYRSTDGSGWKNNVQDNQPWLVDNTASAIGDWYGVTTFDDKPSRVKYLIVEENCLEGRLPEAIGGLRELQALILQWNSRLNCDGLTGQIPPSLGILTNLWELDLSENRLSGTIPDALGNLASLEVLDLSDNRFSGEIPSSLGKLENLYALDLRNNRLEGQIPDKLAELPNLEELYLSGGGNDFTGCIPAALFDIDDHDLDEMELEPCDGSEGTTELAPDVPPSPTPPSVSTPFTRNPAEDFDFPAGDDDPLGIWSDGTTLWVSDRSDSKVRAYVLATKKRDTGKDIPLTVGSRPTGVWSDGTTMWVADIEDAKIYAYTLETNQRDEGQDFDTLYDSGNHSPTGIWSDGTTMWVADWGDIKIYAYNLETKQRDTEEDFERFTDLVDIWIDPSGNGNDLRPWGIWSDTTTLWVTHLIVGSDADRHGTNTGYIYAYNLATKEREKEKDFDTGREYWTVTTLNIAGNSSPRGIWSDGTTMWVVDRRDDKVYAYNLAEKQRDAGKDFDSLSDRGGRSPQGIWSDGTTMWVADFDQKVYAYDVETKQRDPQKDLNTLVDSGSDPPKGIWSDGVTMWVAYWGWESGARSAYIDYGRVNAYDMATKLRDPRKGYYHLSLLNFDAQPQGLWSDGTTMWVSDAKDAKIYAWDSATQDTRVPDKNFEALGAAGNNSPTGIWSDGTTMWVADAEDAKIYAYSLETRERLPDKDFDTLAPAGNSAPGGIWSDGTTMWVVDWQDNKIYAYNMP